MLMVTPVMKKYAATLLQVLYLLIRFLILMRLTKLEIMLLKLEQITLGIKHTSPEGLMNTPAQE